MRLKASSAYIPPSRRCRRADPRALRSAISRWAPMSPGCANANRPHAPTETGVLRGTGCRASSVGFVGRRSTREAGAHGARRTTTPRQPLRSRAAVATDAVQLLRATDTAMFEADRAGKAVGCWPAGSNRRSSERLGLRALHAGCGQILNTSNTQNVPYRAAVDAVWSSVSPAAALGRALSC